MEQPTQEQIKEFWEWCGFALIPHTDRYSSGTQSWIEYQKDGVKVDKPKLDLNNLFKYAMPKLKMLDRFHGISFSLSEEECICEIIQTWYRRTGQDKDPALALFWALWQVKEGNNGS